MRGIGANRWAPPHPSTPPVSLQESRAKISSTAEKATAQLKAAADAMGTKPAQ